MKNFLRRHGYKAEKCDVLYIIRRMDLDGDARLSKKEFVDGLLPCEPYSNFLQRNQIRAGTTKRGRNSKSISKATNYAEQKENIKDGKRDKSRS